MAERFISLRDVLARTALVYLCSPANPQGTVAGIDYMIRLIELAREHHDPQTESACHANRALLEATVGQIVEIGIGKSGRRAPSYRDHVARSFRPA